MTFFAHCFHMISIIAGFVIFLLGVLGLSLWLARLFTSDNEANLVIVFISIAIMVFFSASMGRMGAGGYRKFV